MANRSIMSCCAMFGTLAVATASSSGLRLHGNSHQAQAAGESTAHDAVNKELHRHSVLVKTPQVDQELLICNAYASPHPLDIVAVRSRESLTEGHPLAYRQCKDFTVPLEEGDQLDFRANGLDVGTFYATGLPKSASSLLLIPHRRSPHAVGISFESHAFAELQSPQIAVIDAYRGKAENHAGAVKIIENLPAPSGGKADTTRVEEELKFNSVVAVNPGKYEISLTGTGGDGAAGKPLDAQGKAKYVVVRLGVEGEGTEGGHYPQELIVFPNDAVRLATQSSISLLALAAVLFGLRDMI